MKPRILGCLAFAAFFLVLCLGKTATAVPINFGAVGDSLTDEYSVFAAAFYQSATARNWVDQLATHRAGEVSFGSFDDWSGPPRYTGYEYNYSRLGATTGTLLSEGQHSGVISHPVDVVYLGIGTNDFSAETVDFLDLFNTYGGIYAGGDPTPLVNNLVANFTTALNTIAGPPGSPTGIKVVIGNVGDWGAFPYSRSKYPNAAQRALVTSAIVDANHQIAEIAHDRGLPIVDVFGLLNLQLGLDPLVVGDVSVDLGSPATDNPRYFTLPDGVHPGTIWQGLFANTILEAANQAYGLGLTPFTDQEILAHAGIADPNGGQVTSYYDVSRFVDVTVVPEPSALTTLGIGLSMLAAHVVRRRRLRPTA